MTGLGVKTHTQPTPVASRGTHILMGIPAPGATRGGPALHLPMLVEDLRRAGFRVTTFAYGRWGENEALLVKAWHQLLDLLRYPGVLRAASPDVVHLNSSFDRRALLRDVPFAIVTRLLQRPLLCKWHGSETELLATRAPFWRVLVRILLRTTSALAVLSNEERSAVLRRARTLPCHVVRNGLDLHRYQRRSDPRARLGTPAGAPLLLFIGRLIPAKGLLDVLRALAEMVDTKGAHLVVVGDGPVRVPAEELVRTLQLDRTVHFVGAVSEEAACEYYTGCDVLVFPTYHPEGFPMGVFQSLAAGMGIVTTRIRACADYLREPDHCLFVEPRNPADLARALRRLLEEPELLDRMRRNNRELSRCFDRRRVASEFGHLYEGILQKKGRPLRESRRSK